MSRAGSAIIGACIWMLVPAAFVAATWIPQDIMMQIGDLFLRYGVPIAMFAAFALWGAGRALENYDRRMKAHKGADA